MTDDKKREVLAQVGRVNSDICYGCPIIDRYLEMASQLDIVRCMDCRWWHQSETNEAYGDCGQANGIALKPFDWFCADGERRDS
jgi:hypothetical protein